MTKDDKKRSRIRGCILGAALGDAIGAPFEFRPADEIEARIGSLWIDGLYPFTGEVGPHGIWTDAPPIGTGTDDTRYNWLFLELAIELGKMPSDLELAERFLQVYEQPQAFFPEQYAEHARGQFAMWEGVCNGRLGRSSKLHPHVPPNVLKERSVGLNYPTLIGLIALTSAGLLFPGDPEGAYAAAFQTDFVDIGYARESVAVLAAGISAMSSREDTPGELFADLLSLDPLDLGGYFGGPYIKEKLPAFLDSSPEDCTAPQLAEYHSRKLGGINPFDPFKTLAIAFSAVRFTPDRPLEAILIAANHRGVGESGHLDRYEDIDCYGCVTGALAGALAGAEAFPPTLLEQVVDGNREVYGFDLDDTIRRFSERF
ncbi:MAG: ADP-ribosylglycohydrolase family protein [Gemmatimonadetes bacterium]|nr:ADP-ribosylglycohydrolase family protein [Gemmatimonadota bacterium]